MRQLTFDETYTTREAAREAGAVLYFSGKACPKGHVTARYTINGLCAECNRLAQKARYDANHVTMRRKMTSKKLQGCYGITEAEYAEMFSAQKGRCAVCDMQLISRLDDSRVTKKRQVEVARVDHCHTSGKVRGLLCLHCNTGLGNFKDNKTFLLSAVRYLCESATAYSDSRTQHDTLKGESGPEIRDPNRAVRRVNRRDELSPFIN